MIKVPWFRPRRLPDGLADGRRPLHSGTANVRFAIGYDLTETVRSAVLGRPLPPAEGKCSRASVEDLDVVRGCLRPGAASPELPAECLTGGIEAFT